MYQIPYKKQKDLEVEHHSSVIADKPLLLPEHNHSVFRWLWCTDSESLLTSVYFRNTDLFPVLHVTVCFQCALCLPGSGLADAPEWWTRCENEPVYTRAWSCEISKPFSKPAYFNGQCVIGYIVGVPVWMCLFVPMLTIPLSVSWYTGNVGMFSRYSTYSIHAYIHK